MEQVGSDHALDLLLGARRDIADGPARFAFDWRTVRRHQFVQLLQDAQVDHVLRLLVAARHDVADCKD